MPRYIQCLFLIQGSSRGKPIRNDHLSILDVFVSFFLHPKWFVLFDTCQICVMLAGMRHNITGPSHLHEELHRLYLLVLGLVVYTNIVNNRPGRVFYVLALSWASSAELTHEQKRSSPWASSARSFLSTVLGVCSWPQSSLTHNGLRCSEFGLKANGRCLILQENNYNLYNISKRTCFSRIGINGKP